MITSAVTTPRYSSIFFPWSVEVVETNILKIFYYIKITEKSIIVLSRLLINRYFRKNKHKLKLVRIISLLLLPLFHTTAFTQTTFSIATDLSAVRNQKTNQQFWTAGNTIKCEIHLTKKDGPYAWVSYIIPAKFKNSLSADAKSPATSPQSIAFVNKAKMNIKQVSIGWKHYFKGGSNTDVNWSLYGMAGFGIIGGNVSNNFQTAIDTSVYTVPVINGTSRFKRLTADLGLGWEFPISGDLIIYNDLTVWVPASDYPSKYLVANDKAPMILSFHFGLRIFFD